MSKNTSIVQFRPFLSEFWAFESSHLFLNQFTKILKVHVVGALSKLANALSKLLVVVMKVVGYTSCELIYD